MVSNGESHFSLLTANKCFVRIHFSNSMFLPVSLRIHFWNEILTSLKEMDILAYSFPSGWNSSHTFKGRGKTRLIQLLNFFLPKTDDENSFTQNINFKYT